MAFIWISFLGMWLLYNMRELYALKHLWFFVIFLPTFGFKVFLELSLYLLCLLVFSLTSSTDSTSNSLIIADDSTGQDHGTTLLRILPSKQMSVTYVPVMWWGMASGGIHFISSFWSQRPGLRKKGKNNWLTFVYCITNLWKLKELIQIMLVIT